MNLTINTSELIDLFAAFELELGFLNSESDTVTKLREMVLWIKSDIPVGGFAPTVDGRSLPKVVRHIFDSTHFTLDELTEFALNECSFSCEGTGVSYPEDWDADDLEECGIYRPTEVVVLSYWIGGFSDVLIPRTSYIQTLLQYLIENSRDDLVVRLNKALCVASKVGLSPLQHRSLHLLLLNIEPELRLSQSRKLNELNGKMQALRDLLRDTDAALGISSQLEVKTWGHVRQYDLW
ncbi:hypothetical protein KP803_15485 [Vibrio sp. ZSDE26]|uniref:Uncharacterized protein n=1 Tax=Vibrio amylolyticus TaxID=2847292 RepID=A0A9X2BI64_9VIBR|nr:hypothetical protein [Vibrio amylolyticus]MCK6264681.1 hypothetical protein [Vibrio amylolyticus]